MASLVTSILNSFWGDGKLIFSTRKKIKKIITRNITAFAALLKMDCPRDGCCLNLSCIVIKYI